jgi:hypothetical protein
MLLSLVAAKIPHHMRKKACFTHHFDNNLDIEADTNQIANNISHSGSHFEQNL